MLDEAREGLVLYSGTTDHFYVLVTDVPRMEGGGVRVIQKLTFRMKEGGCSDVLGASFRWRKDALDTVQGHKMRGENRVSIDFGGAVGWSHVHYDDVECERLVIFGEQLGGDKYAWRSGRTGEVIDCYNPFGEDLDTFR